MAKGTKALIIILLDSDCCFSSKVSFDNYANFTGWQIPLAALLLLLYYLLSLRH